MRRKLYIMVGCFIAIITLGAFTGIDQQRPQEDPEFTNLKILPKDISHEELEAVMKSFKDALGVKCSFCHVRSKEDRTQLDFASDENHHKEIAREMMKITMKINKKYFKNLEHDGVAMKLSCMTCHNGKAEPVMVKEM